MTAMDALHMKMILRDDMKNPMWLTLTESFLASFEHGGDPAEGKRQRLAPGQMPIAHPGATHGETIKDIAVRMENCLDAGYAFYVDRRMMPLITAAAETMPQESLEIGDLPTEHGFLLVPGGIGHIDVRGKPLKINAFMWDRIGSTVRITWLVDKHDREDASNIELADRLSPATWARMPRLTIAHLTEMRFGEPLPMSFGPDFMVPPDVKINVIQHTDADGNMSMGWAIEDNGYSAEELQDRVGNFRMRTDPVSRWLLTVWRLMQQSITDVHEEVPPRQLRRLIERKNLPDKKVTVIALRRSAAKGDGTTEVEWTHQWMVRGYWKQQPYKDEHGEWQKRVIYIHPHLKGPPDKPLLIRDHVYSLQR